MRFDRLGVGLGLSLLLFASPALAIGETGECASDADCAAGLGCVERTYTICEDSTPAGGAGGEGARGGEVGCYEVVERACAPKPCTTDAECGGGTSCVGFTYVVCSGGGEPGTGGRPDPGPGGEGGAGAAGGAGGEPDTGAGAAGGSVGGAGGAAPDECVEITEAYCVPPWLAPCQADADCGPGFRCIEDVICTEPPPPPPGGAGGMGGAGGGACGPSDVKHCELIPTPCGSSADCGAGLTCEDFSTVICGDDEPGEPPPPPDGGTGGTGGSPGGDDDGTGGRPNEGGVGGDAGGAGGGPDCRDEPLSLCVPPGFVDWLGAYGPTGGGRVDDGYGGRGGSAPSAEDAGAPGADAEDGSAFGCQTGGTGGGFSILALLGVALLLRRR